MLLLIFSALLSFFELFNLKNRVKVQVFFEMQNYFYNNLPLFLLKLRKIAIL